MKSFFVKKLEEVVTVKDDKKTRSRKRKRYALEHVKDQNDELLARN